MPNPGNSGAPFDLVSHGRRGPGRRDHLSPAQLEQIARTVRRTPEVMVKVLSTGATRVGHVKKHVDYIGREGELDLQTDDGEKLRGDAASELLEDWNLDVEENRQHSDLRSTNRREPPRLVHKLIFSMPAGTPPSKVLTATQSFCREEFALKHRYVMALHTDEPHPHVHVVVKAMSEQGKRLNIRKPLLREWRQKFAMQLRAIGVEANATDRFIRGVTTPQKRDPIYRAARRGESRHWRGRMDAVARELSAGKLHVEPAKSQLMQTRTAMENGWLAVGDLLLAQGHRQLAAHVQRFVDQLPSPRTEKEWLAHQLHNRLTRLKSLEQEMSR